MSKGCLQCGDTGIRLDGSKCSCDAGKDVSLPTVLEVPNIYQSSEFSASLVPIAMPREYGIELEDIIEVIKNKGKLSYNLLICSPPNTGKTVFAYTIFKHQYYKGLPMSPIMDLVEARELLYSNSYNDNIIEEKNKLILSPIIVIKIPLDLPNKFGETISTIIERRIRKNGTTIFLYGGSKFDLFNQDRFGVLKSIIKDGSYNSLKLIDYRPFTKEE